MLNLVAAHDLGGAYKTYPTPAKTGNEPKKIFILQQPKHQAIRHMLLGIQEVLDQEKGAYEVRHDILGRDRDAVEHLANRIIADGAAVVVALATPTAMTIASYLKGTGIQLVFVGVSDPVGAGLLIHEARTYKNTTGIVDKLPLDKLVDFAALFTDQRKTIGVLYTATERNVKFQLQHLSYYAADRQISTHTVPVAANDNVRLTTELLAQQTNTILVLNDNALTPYMDDITQVAEKNGAVVVACDSFALADGAVAALSSDPLEVGRQAGRLVVQALSQSPLLPRPVVLERPTIYIKKEVLSALKREGKNPGRLNIDIETR